MGAVIDGIDHIMGVLTIHSAANRLGSAQDLLADPTELPGHGPWSHHTSGLVDVVHGDVPVVFDVLHLLTITVRLLQSLDDHSSGRGTDGDLQRNN